MKLLNNHILVLFFILIANIGFATNKIIEKKLTPEIIVSQLRDSSYLNQVGQIIYSNDRLYMAEYTRNQIIVFDKDLNSINTIGRQGRGPKEITQMGMGIFSVSNSTVYVNDGGGMRMQIYHSNGNYIKSISYAKISTDINMYYGYTYVNDILTIGSKGENALVKYDFSNEAPRKIKSFGKRHDSDSYREDLMINCCFIGVIDNKAVAIGIHKPFLELYDLNDRLLQNYDMSNVAIVEDEIEYEETQSNPSNSTIIYVSNYCIYNNNLYLLFNTSNPVYNCNTVIKFALEKNEFKHKATYKLPNRVYQGIAVNGNHLYSFDIDDSSICRFKL